MLRHLTFSGKNCNHINGICLTWFWLISKKLSNHFELMKFYFIVILTWNVSIILSHFKCKWTAIDNLAFFITWSHSQFLCIINSFAIAHFVHLIFIQTNFKNDGIYFVMSFLFKFHFKMNPSRWAATAVKNQNERKFLNWNQLNRALNN